jgi:hypothetical protein
MKNLLLLFAAIQLSYSCALAGQPSILSFSPATGLFWTNAVQGRLSVIEQAPDPAGPWVPFFYDWGTNGLFNTRLPTNSSAQSFYRVGIITNIPDPSLIMHLSFDNEFAAGTVLDLSGYGNHGRRYGRPLYPTNWPSLTTGPDGSRAALFKQYWDGYGLYGRSGDYIGIPSSTSLVNMPEATISIWAHYFRSPDGNIGNDHNSTLMNSGKDVPGTFFFGRTYASYTSFDVNISPTSSIEVLRFPDVAPDGDTGDWHHYAITFSGGTCIGYFDGKPFATNTVPVGMLTMAGHYIGIGVWTFNVTPELDLSVDQHPNNGWINGKLDDVRIYRRALGSSELQSLYMQFDKLPPNMPAGAFATANSSSLVSLRWNPARDLFGVRDYLIFRDGVLIGITNRFLFYDSGLQPGNSYIYTIRARDFSGNLSLPTPGMHVTTRTPLGGMEIIIDDGDGDPWVITNGFWSVGMTNTSSLSGTYGPTFLSDDAIGKGKHVSFYPPLDATGEYEVLIRHPGKADATHLFSTAVPVDIVSGIRTTTVFVNQRTGIGQWKSLGRFALDPGAFVRIRTDGTSTSHYVLADAVRFIR